MVAAACLETVARPGSIAPAQQRPLDNASMTLTVEPTVAMLATDLLERVALVARPVRVDRAVRLDRAVLAVLLAQVEQAAPVARLVRAARLVQAALAEPLVPAVRTLARTVARTPTPMHPLTTLVRWKAEAAQRQAEATVLRSSLWS
jgi:type IV secretory pathway VirJ component